MKGTTNSHKLIKTSKQNYGMLKVGDYLEVSDGVVSVDADSFASASHVHSADDITSGTLNTARIPDLNASKITAGTLELARIPTITADKIGSGAVTNEKVASGIDASKITSVSGSKLPLEVIPKGAIEKLEVVANKQARLALTIADVQNGDTVKEADTGLMYFVKDETKLGTENAFEVYTAGRASAVDWAGVENKVDATSSVNGLMSSAHFTKVEGIEAGAEVNVLEGVQVNGGDLTISNKKVNIPIASNSVLGLFKVGSNLTIAQDGTLSAVAEAQEQADWNQTTTTAKSYIKNKPHVSTSVNACDTTTTVSGDSTDSQLPTAKSVYGFVNTGYVAKDGSKVLSTNDFTDALKTKLEGIEAGAEVNVIETVKVNDTALTVTNKAVNVTVPTALSQLSADSTHAFVTDAEKAGWNAKQNALTFDSTPTADSDNPVKSGGIYTALAGKEPTITKNDAFNKNYGLVADVKMDGTASAGSVDAIARIDHIHPHDTAKEDVSNKVTSIGSTSTDTQYASAKAVYDTLHSMIISQTGATVEITGWEADTTVSGYNYHKDITVSDVTANHFAIVTFNENDAIGMNYAQENDTGAGYVRIYAVAVPTTATAVNIIAYKAV